MKERRGVLRRIRRVFSFLNIKDAASPSSRGIKLGSGTFARFIKLKPMRRIVLLLLLIVLPLQFGLSAVVNARVHVNDGHHHAASHLSDANQAVATESDRSGNSIVAHANCDACHFCHALAYLGELPPALRFASASDMPSTPLDAHASTTVRDRPHRPKWMFLV